ncbi:MAG: hypothetical protein WDZ29_07685 [Balneolaceae bacterium]
MIPKWLHTLLLDSGSKRLERDLWNHRITGNMLEISSVPRFERDPEHYRMAVIRIGQFLQSIDCKAAQEGLQPMIQSFPHLEQPHLVAVVRFFSSQEDTGPEQNRLEVSEPSINDPVLLMRSIASHYGLVLQPVPEPVHKLDSKRSGYPDTMDLFTEKDLSGHNQPLGPVHLLCSMNDNPFIWLKTGFWMERSYSFHHLFKDGSTPLVTERISIADRSRFGSLCGSCRFAQAAVLG